MRNEYGYGAEGVRGWLTTRFFSSPSIGIISGAMAEVVREERPFDRGWQSVCLIGRQAERLRLALVPRATTGAPPINL